MRKISLLCTLFVFLTVPFFKTLYAASFDCSKASTAVEGSICANKTLSDLDIKLSDAYKQARAQSSDLSALQKEQIAWIKNRNACGANVDCLSKAYEQRIAVLKTGTASTAKTGIEIIDGNWYSNQWKYGYVLQNGIGIATSTNTPNFKVGQNIIQLSQSGPNRFVGRQIYKDGKFYKITATLLPDGRLQFEGELNAKWTMEKLGSSPVASASVSQNNNAPSAPHSPRTNQSQTINALAYVLNKKWSLDELDCNLNGGAYQVFSRNLPMGFAFYTGGKTNASTNPQEFQFIEKNSNEFTHIAKIGANDFVRRQLRVANIMVMEIRTDVKLVSLNKIVYNKVIKQLNFDAMTNGKVRYDTQNESGYGELCL